MNGGFWQRPSAIVLVAAAVVLAVFVGRGDLAVAKPQPELGKLPEAVPAGVSADALAGAPESAVIAPPAARPPVVVKADKSARAAAAQRLAVAGRVIDSSGLRIVGAQVFANEQLVATSGADGAFVAELPSFGLPLLVRAHGCRPAWLRPVVDAPDLLHVQLAPAAPWDVDVEPPLALSSALRGEGMVRGEDGSPLAGALVTAVGGAAFARTDELGRYSLVLPSANPVLLVHRPDAGDGGGHAARSEPLLLPRDRGAVPLPELIAQPAAALRGILRDGRGNPVAGVPLRVQGEGLTRYLETGMSGMFRLSGLLPGRYELQPLGHRGEPGRRQEVLVDQSLVECELRLQAPVERRLQVVDEAGASQPGVFVATVLDGERRALAVADPQGMATLPFVVGDVDFDVRSGSGYEALAVKRLDAEAGLLVVASP